MLKQIIAAAAALTAGILPFSGVASADEGRTFADARNDYDQVGLLNLNNTDVLHDVNAALGVCDNNINVLGVQVEVEDVANGVDVPILSPGDSEANGATPENCASSSLTNGGLVQDN